MLTTYVPVTLPADVIALAVDHRGRRTVALSTSAHAAEIAAALTAIPHQIKE